MNNFILHNPEGYTTCPDDPAFPEDEGTNSGLSIREYMATHIAAGVAAGWSYLGSPGGQSIAKMSVSITDRLIEELNK